SLFFFSSRRRHTRFSRDWSSDVCSSDLADAFAVAPASPARWRLMPQGDGTPAELPRLSLGQAHERAVDALARTVREQDADWLRAARVRLERELEGLYSYCRAALDHDEAGGVETGGRTRMTEPETLA